MEEFIQQRKLTGKLNEKITIGMFDHYFHLVAEDESILRYDVKLKFTGGGTDFFQGIQGIMGYIK